jgi:hypothetical protein
MLLELDRRTQHALVPVLVRRVDVAVAEFYRRGYRRPTQASPLYSPVPSATACIARLGASSTVGASGEARPSAACKGHNIDAKICLERWKNKQRRTSHLGEFQFRGWGWEGAVGRARIDEANRHIEVKYAE